jgi:hypothetical protein
MNKQTAVEWLIEQVKSSEWQNYFIWHKEEVFQQAKEMEKKQITDAYSIGIYQGRMDKSLTMDQYYIENFKNNNNAKK